MVHTTHPYHAKDTLRPPSGVIECDDGRGEGEKVSLAGGLWFHELKDRGEYEAARDVMFPLWEGIGSRPNTKGLEANHVPRVLLCAGILTGWLGGVSGTKLNHLPAVPHELSREPDDNAS